MRALVLVVLVRLAQADPIAEREREATRLEQQGELARAASIRAALGQRAQWIADVERAPTVDALFELARVSPPHLRRYLARHALAGGPERAVIARVLRGEQLWTASCRAAVDGLCLRALAALPNSCARRTRWVVVPRDERAATAIGMLTTAVTTFDRTPSQRADVRAAYANAKRILADVALEATAARPLPALSFTTPGATRRSKQRFEAWVEVRLTDAIRRRYETVIALREPDAMLASALRIGQHDALLVSELVTSKVPHRLDAFGADARAAYCERMLEVAAPLDARVVEALSACVATASELSRGGIWADACRRSLERVAPDEFPPLREKVARPGPIR